MAAIDFPASPTNGQTFTSGDKTWVYSTTTSAWGLQTQTITGPTGPTGAAGGAVSSMGYVSTDYYGPYTHGLTNISSGMTYQATYYVPFLVTETATFDRIAITAGSGITGSVNVRLGIYNNSGGKPSTVVLDAGTVTATTANTVYQITISQSLSTGWYWLAALSESNTSTAYFGGTTSDYAFGFPARYNSTGFCATREPLWVQYSTTVGGFATAGTLTDDTTAPVVLLRKS